MNITNSTKVTLIGASRGIGRTFAERFHAAGAQVLVVARGKDALDQLARDLIGIKTLQLDATEPDAADRVLKAQTPDILVLCVTARCLCKCLSHILSIKQAQK